MDLKSKAIHFGDEPVKRRIRIRICSPRVKSFLRSGIDALSVHISPSFLYLIYIFPTIYYLAKEFVRLISIE